MGAILNKNCTKDGVVAYQDDQDKNRFHYLPQRIDAVLGETLTSFKVNYFGINPQPFYASISGGQHQSVVGGTLSGQAIPNMTKKQAAAIAAEVTKVFKVKAPTLVPLLMTDVTVQPVFAKNIAQLGGGSTEFPSKVQFGSQFGYSIGANNSLFAEMVGMARPQTDLGPANPDFAVNIYGTAEFYGDPWEAEIEADLKQVWEYTRKKVSGGLSLGWFNVGFDVDKISQELIKTNVIKIRYKEGNGGQEFGRQLLETTKTVFEAINKQITTGEGMFRFEPNPTPQQPTTKDSWAASLLPWTLSVNTSVMENFFSQSISFKETVSFTGLVKVPVNTSMALAVDCNSATAQYFNDVQDKLSSCIDNAKSAGLQSRMRQEAKAQLAKIKLYEEMMNAKTITPPQYIELVTFLKTISLTEGLEPETDMARLAEFLNVRMKTSG